MAMHDKALEVHRRLMGERADQSARREAAARELTRERTRVALEAKPSSPEGTKKPS